eukprot:6541250-Pyramimonas_sp.AAC.1
MFMTTSKFAVRCKLGGAATPWLLPLTHFPKSAAVAWPLQEHAPAGGGFTFMRLSADVPDLRELLHAVVDPSDWEAIPVEWVSVYSQCLLLGDQGPRQLPGGLG